MAWKRTDYDCVLLQVIRRDRGIFLRYGKGVAIPISIATARSLASDLVRFSDAIEAETQETNATKEE